MKLLTVVSAALTLSLLLVGIPASADDGQMLRRSVSSPPGITEDPEPEGEHAFISLMNFRVPMQRASGLVADEGLGEYYDVDDTLRMTLTTAKPLINVYVYGPVIGFDDFSQSGFPGHGRRDAFGAVSLDDGETWKATNLSNSAGESSFVLQDPIPDPGVPAGDGTVIVVDDPDGAFIEEVEWEAKKTDGKLHVHGDTNTDSREEVTIRDAVSQEELFSFKSSKDGEFEKEVKVAEVPCWVQAGVDGEFGPAIEVPLEDDDECVNPDAGDVTLIVDYPGDVNNVFHSTAGNRVMVAWQSKFCRAGFPGYSLEDDEKDELATYLEIDVETDLYLEDLFVVGGSQESVDYREQEAFDGEYDDVAEVPYNCLWTARGILREDPEVLGTTELVWMQAERLTSGRRDVNRVETKCVAGAGCAVTWQEDPNGLRPGEGEGPGTGWAGSTVAHKTDIFYSFIEWEDMDIVLDDQDAFVPLADNIMDSGRPTPAIPMMVPVRLTNNDKCNQPVTLLEETYCNDAIAEPYGIEDQCVGTVEIPLGPQDTLTPICVVDNNDSGSMDYGDLPNVANTGASRPRLNLQPRDSDGDGVTDDAWIVIVHEESKGLGAFGFLNDEAWLGNIDDTATACDDPDGDLEDNCEEEIGKNQWYISFAMGTPQTSLLDETVASDVDYSMISNIVEQQNMYNAPEVNFATGTYYPPMNTEDMWGFGDLDFSIFNNEIARRASLMSQSLAKAEASANKLVAMPLFKEGVMNQGGPADIMARRVVLPDDWTNEQTANPYAFANMECAWYDGEGGVTDGLWIYEADENPYYPDGLCGAPSINLSGRTPHECSETGESDGICPTEDLTCEDDTDFGQLCLGDIDIDPEDNQVLDMMNSWYECPGWNGTDVSNSGNTGSSTIPGDCYSEPASQVLMANTDDRSWYNPMDISKAHRGFLDGDHVFLLYAYSPNYKLNAVGHDRYELYTRRSFDGGISWTVTPDQFVAANGDTYAGEGTTTCQTWRDGSDSTTDSHICTEYEAGDPEQSRDVSQHKSMKITTLDPRYSPTIASMPEECPDWYMLDGVCLSDWLLFDPITDDNLQGGLDPTDVKEPSRNWVVFESGDNTTVAVGEAEPLNLDYGRGEFFGDHLTVWSEIDTDLSDPYADCYPSNAHDTTDVDWASGTGFCNEFDTLEGFPLALSEEASITSSAYGDFLYGVWGQFNMEEDEDGEHVFVDGDSMFRRVWYIDEWISDDAYTLPGTN